MKRPWIVAIIVATIFIVFRIFSAVYPDLANTSPIIALLFCGTALWKSNRWILPTALTAWFISTPLVNSLQGYPILESTLQVLIAFIIVITLGFFMISRSTAKFMPKLIGGTIISAILFYLITNTMVFFADPIYVKSLDGYIQCMWTGTPAYGGNPTWVFFRNSLLANTIASCLFIILMQLPVITKATHYNLSKQATV